MNHDDTNLNPEHDPALRTWIEPELEARIVAWVADEASAFEIAELERLVAARPELLVFKRRIEAVHGLVAEAALPDKKIVRLSPERRAKVLNAIGARIPDDTTTTPVVPHDQPASRWSGRAARFYYVLGGLAAACLIIVLQFSQRQRSAGRDIALDRGRTEQAEQATPTALPKLASKGLASGSLTLGAPGKATEVDQLNGAKARSTNRVAADSRGDMRVTFGDSVISPVPRMNDASASTLPSSDGLVTFGGAAGAAKSDAGEPSTVTGPITLGATTAPTEAAPSVQAKDEIAPSAFTVTAPKKNDGDSALAGRDTAVARSGERAFAGGIAGGKRSEFKEEQTPTADDTRAKAGKPGATDADTSTAKESVSTFSLQVSDVSFRLAVAAAAAFERGENPKMPEVRPEEFYNAFDYGDPAPGVAEKVGARIEQSVHPVLQQRNLLRIALKVPAAGRGAGQPLRLTVLLDTSGPMEREDRRLAVRRALEELIALLGPNDRVTLIGFSRQPRLLAEAVPGNQAGHLVGMSASTPAEGGTNLEQALKLAGELALRHRLESAQNRIVLITDGAANLGNADPAQLATMVETLRQQRIAFDACGIGLEGIGDNVLEALTRKGDGRYYVINRPEAADAAFARQLAGAFRPAAENVKLQVRFNSARVGNYRLIGFEQHRLRAEDFRDDKVDAAEFAADEEATALYQVEVLPQGSGEIGDVYVRFRDAATGAMVERSWTIRHDAQAPRFERASPSLQLAGVAALVAEKINESALAKQFKLGDFAAVVNSLRGPYAREARVQELVVLYGRLRRMSGE